MAKDWTDAEFEVVGNHYRPGERHRDPKHKRWIFTGREDLFGRPLWYKPPRFSKLALFAVLCAIYPGGAIVLWLVVWAAHKLASYWPG
ncbi:hypothetical protein [Phenylobacterium soli]|uniref:Uncharacterized protein n=1 Tax=Phenylobacterium soli TaxID=2170551 RepID=A0A328A9A6_9CAUL|nr:hypothetical protein [Phenylobacterium soli]RAK51190.1 hypothetical protein DJ017_19725 [Phenylobacterium soli]